MRLFVALNLPKKERDRIYRKARALRDLELPIRWVEPEHYHLTLKFLGELHPDRVGRTQEILARVGTGAQGFEARLGGFGAFPTMRRPRVLWIGVEPSPALRCLKQDLEWALAECGFERETRAFHPHVTLGRSTQEGGAGLLRGLETVMAGLTHDGGFRVRSLDLMESQLSKQGPRYTILRSIHLGAGE